MCGSFRTLARAVRARKLILRSLLAVTVVLAAGAGLSYWAFRGTPDFYRRPTLSAQERADAAKRAEDKIIHTREWANDLWTAEQRSIAGGTSASTQPATAAARQGQPFT